MVLPIWQRVCVDFLSAQSNFCRCVTVSLVPNILRRWEMFPSECFDRIFLGDGDTKDIHMLKAKLERGYRRAASEDWVGRLTMSRPGTDFNSMILGRRDVGAEGGSGRSILRGREGVS